jgi:ribosomal protein L22
MPESKKNEQTHLKPNQLDEKVHQLESSTANATANLANLEQSRLKMSQIQQKQTHWCI